MVENAISRALISIRVLPTSLKVSHSREIDLLSANIPLDADRNYTLNNIL